MIYLPFSLSNDDKINYDSTALIYGAPLPWSKYHFTYWKIISYVVGREMSNLKGQSVRIYRLYKLYHFNTFFHNAYLHNHGLYLKSHTRKNEIFIFDINTIIEWRFTHKADLHKFWTCFYKHIQNIYLMLLIYLMKLKAIT